MSRRISYLARGPALVAVLVVALALGGIAVAQFTGDDFVLGPGGPTGGGGSSAGGDYELFGSIGQPLAGSASGGEFVLGGGVVSSAAEADPDDGQPPDNGEPPDDEHNLVVPGLARNP